MFRYKYKRVPDPHTHPALPPVHTFYAFLPFTALQETNAYFASVPVPQESLRSLFYESLLEESAMAYRYTRALPNTKQASGGKKYFLPDHSRHLPVMQNKEQLAVPMMAPTNDSGRVEPLMQLFLKLQRCTSAPY